MLRRSLVTCMTLFLISGFASIAPASAQPGVRVSIPSGSGSPSAASQNLPGYSPATLTVVIGVNNTVTWDNNDTVSHTVTIVTQPAGGGFVDSGTMPANASYSFTFTVPGTYMYGCSFHSWMHGTVIVLAATSSTKTAPEFPAAWLAVVLFAAVAGAVAITPRMRSRLQPAPAT
jgi:plastocyanin